MSNGHHFSPHVHVLQKAYMFFLLQSLFSALIFLRSEKSDVAMVRTDQFLEVCFSQYGVIQTDVIVIRYVIENFKSYRLVYF
jgi:hypothetical protein